MARNRPLLLLSLGLGVFAATLAPSTAAACGGTFCDGANPAMLVDQAGEDILFARDGDMLEVHVRIQYTGEAENFAWVVPMVDVPEVSIGSDFLFRELARATVPRWDTDFLIEDEGGDPCPWGGCLDAQQGGPNRPNVVYEAIVGAFEVVVLDAASAADVLAFFDANSYAYQASAAPLLQEYIDEGFLLTAVKLSAGAEVDEIHPLVFRLASDEPCIPLRLTAVAAEDDMAVRAYFLGDERWAPSNYAHVVLNPLAYDWNTPLATNYLELLGLAVDEAGGRAFVTEYAGSSGGVSEFGIWGESWNPEALIDASANEAIDALMAMGLIAGDQINGHVLAALRTYIPVPDFWNLSEAEFWLDHADHPQLLDAIDFDSAGFAAMLDLRLFDPARDAIELLEAWPVLTRLHTLISPAEMILDPTFHPAPDLPDVLERRRAEARVLAFSPWTRYEVPHEAALGETPELELVCMPDDIWTGFEDLPRALRVEHIPMFGPPQLELDNSELVRQAAEATFADSTVCVPVPGPGGGETGGATTSTGTSTGPAALPESGASCACSSNASAGSSPGRDLILLLFGLTLLGLRRPASHHRVRRVLAASPAMPSWAREWHASNSFRGRGPGR